MPQPDCVGAAPVRQAPILPLFVIVSASRAVPFSPFVDRRYVQPALTCNCREPLESVHPELAAFGPRIADRRMHAPWRCTTSGGIGLRRPSRGGWGSSQEHTSALRNLAMISSGRQRVCGMSCLLDRSEEPYFNLDRSRGCRSLSLALLAPDRLQRCCLKRSIITRRGSPRSR